MKAKKGRRISAAIFGATGYVGGEMLRLVAGHPNFQLAAAVSDSRAGDRIGEAFPHLAGTFGHTRFVAYEDWIEHVGGKPELALFSAAPHGASARIIESAIRRAEAHGMTVHVVDASADFRYRTQQEFERVYGTDHGAPELLGAFSSGLPEHVAGTPTRHVGHPGCFATAVLLAAVPLLQHGLCDGELFVTGITGSTGSGRTPTAGTHHPQRHSNLYAYKALEHRHAPEIVALAGAASGSRPTLNFVPHSGPFARGIYVTLQTRAGDGATARSIRDAFAASYASSPFVSVVDGVPRLKDVVASNACHIGATTNAGTIVVCSAIDNLVKGAAGGAMQWMNRLFALPETAGLDLPAPGWT